MGVYIGDTGLDASYQDAFKKTTKCIHCGEKARIMFVVMEKEGGKNRYVCELRINTGKKGSLWLHDAMACASYLCPHCFGVTSIMNQA